jgi:hypothetical protein
VFFFVTFLTISTFYLVRGDFMSIIKRFTYVLLFICLTIGIGINVSSAPDPLEVDEIKTNAPVHVIGTVKEDILYKEKSKEDGIHFQIRQVVLEVSEIKKQNDSLQKKLDIFYHYIPLWQADLWSGGERVDIAVGDKIEIWLKKGEYGFVPALGGNTIKHLTYMEERPEYIKEPIFHYFTRTLLDLWKLNQGYFILGILLLLLSYIYLKAYRTKMKDPFQ